MKIPIPVGDLRSRVRGWVCGITSWVDNKAFFLWFRTWTVKKGERRAGRVRSSRILQIGTVETATFENLFVQSKQVVQTRFNLVTIACDTRCKKNKRAKKDCPRGGDQSCSTIYHNHLDAPSQTVRKSASVCPRWPQYGFRTEPRQVLTSQ